MHPVNAFAETDVSVFILHIQIKKKKKKSCVFTDKVKKNSSKVY